MNRTVYWETAAAYAGAPDAAEGRIMAALKAAYPGAITRERLSATAAIKGGYFQRTVSAMATAGFIEYPEKASVRLQDWTVMR